MRTLARRLDCVKRILSLDRFWKELSSAILGPAPSPSRLRFVHGVEQKIHEHARSLVDRLGYLLLACGKRNSATTILCGTLTAVAHELIEPKSHYELYSAEQARQDWLRAEQEEQDCLRAEQQIQEPQRHVGS